MEELITKLEAVLRKETELEDILKTIKGEKEILLEELLKTMRTDEKRTPFATFIVYLDAKIRGELPENFYKTELKTTLDKARVIEYYSAIGANPDVEIIKKIKVIKKRR